MRKNKILFAVLTAALALTLVLAGCSKKDSSGGSAGGSSSGGSASAKSSGGGKANLATDFSYDLTADGQGIIIKDYTGKPGKVVIPAKIEDIPVVEIGTYAFDGKSTSFSYAGSGGAAGVSTSSSENNKAGITSIIIPDTVKKIGRSAFKNTAITSIVIPDSVTDSGMEIFYECNKLTEIKFSDNMETIPEGCARRLSALKKVTLPKNLKNIGDGAFHGCGELTELVIPDTLTSVKFIMLDYPTDAFEGCGKLPIKTRQKLQELGYKGSF